MSTIKIPSHDADEIVDGDHEGWTTVETKITGQRRWEITKTGVFKHEKSGKLYRIDWSDPATEIQDGMERFYTSMVTAQEVQPIEVRVIQYHELGE